MRKPSRGLLRGALAVALAATLTLAGCSDDDGSTDADPPEAGGSSTAPGTTDSTDPADSAAPEDDTPTPDLPIAPDLSYTIGAAEDLDFDLESCMTGAGMQVAKGRLTNPTKKPVAYVVTVTWVAEDLDVRGRGVAVLRQVKPGATVKWSLKGEVGEGADSCVPNALRGKLAKGKG